MKTLLFALVLVLGPVGFARTNVREDVLTVQDVARIRSVSAAEISPDGKRVAFLRLVPRNAGVDEDGAPWTELWVLDLEDGRERPFITGKVDVGSIEWTDDGEGIAFLAKRGDDKFTSLYVIPTAGGEARRELSMGSSIAAYSFSPDRKRVAVAAKDPEDAERKKLQDKGFKQEIYEEDEKFTRAWIAELGEGKPAPRALPLEGSIHQIAWSPADERILVTMSPTPLVDDQYMRQRIRIVDSKSGEILARIQNPGKLDKVAWSPDGKRVAMVTAADMNDPDAGRLAICSTDGGEPVDLFPGWKGEAEEFAWQTPDVLMYTGSEGVWSVFGKATIDAQGRATDKKIIPAGTVVLSSLSMSEDGQHGAFCGHSAAHASEVFSMSHGDAAPKRRTDSNPWLGGKRMAKQEVVTWKARDGLELEGVLVRPLDEVKGQRYPLIVYVHGGPEAHEMNGWQTGYSKPGQVAAAAGFATFYPNYRGSTGRGVEFSKSSQGDAGGKEFDDLVDAVDHLVSMGLVDKDKVGITGGSYGGYATAWCATKHSDRFAAGVMFVGISDKISKIGTTDIPDEEFYVHARKRVWDDWTDMLERSPIFYADQCKTPLLILHGKDDPRVNPGQSREMYRHLKLRGKAPVRLVLYPGEGHGNRKACARLDYNVRMMQWMEHYLKGPGGDMPPSAVEYSEPTPKADAAQAMPASAGAPGK